MAGAVVAAAATYFAARSQSHANEHATNAQVHSTDAALDYQKGRDQIADKRYDDKWQAYQKYVDEWKARHGYGGNTPLGNIHFGPASGQAPVNPPAQAQGTSLRDLASTGPVPGGTSPMPSESGTLQDLSKWQDWDQYLR